MVEVRFVDMSMDGVSFVPSVVVLKGVPYMKISLLEQLLDKQAAAFIKIRKENLPFER